MINQVDFEGYLTRSWEYREQRFMHLANHRPGENGKTLLNPATTDDEHLESEFEDRVSGMDR
jgi:hypothetical protein